MLNLSNTAVLTRDRQKHRAYKPGALQSTGSPGPHGVTGAGMGPHGTWDPAGPLGEPPSPARPHPCLHGWDNGRALPPPAAGCEEEYVETEVPRAPKDGCFP